jgi:polyisoprenoid-binding protein YceI
MQMIHFFSKQYFFSALLLVLLSSLNVRAEVETYQIDPHHSSVNFLIRHVVAKLSGSFSDVNGELRIDRSNLANSSVQARINMSSVNTHHAKRDEHIKKSDYLDVMQFAEMQFVSSKIEPGKQADEGLVTGTLTLHGVSKTLTFPFKILGFGNDPWGGQRTGIQASTVIKASDFGFQWGLKPQAPVGDDIEVTLLLEGVKAKSAQ